MELVAQSKNTSYCFDRVVETSATNPEVLVTIRFNFETNMVTLVEIGRSSHYNQNCVYFAKGLKDLQPKVLDPDTMPSDLPVELQENYAALMARRDEPR